VFTPYILPTVEILFVLAPCTLPDSVKYVLALAEMHMHYRIIVNIVYIVYIVITESANPKPNGLWTCNYSA